MRCLVCVALLAIAPGLAAAQDRDRPPAQELFLTEVVFAQERHELQLAFASIIDRSRSDSAGVMPLSVEFGLTNRWQIQAEADWATQFHSAGSSVETTRLSVGTKYSFMHIGGSPVHAAIGVDVEWPRPNSLAEAEGEGGVEFEPFAAVAVDLGPHVELFGSAAASLERTQAADLFTSKEIQDDVGTISGGVMLSFRKVTVAVEYSSRGDILPWRNGEPPILMPSVIIKPAKQWEISVGALVSLDGGAHQIGPGLRIVKEF